MGVREAKVEKYLKDGVELLGGESLKWISPEASGVPDRIVMLRGRVYFVEVKTVDGRLSGEQRRMHRRLAKQGVTVLTVAGHDQVDAFLRQLEQVQ